MNILPMTNDRVETHIELNDACVHFQEYLIKRKMEGEIKSIRYVGIENSTPAPNVIESIQKAKAIIIAPSNPLVSVEPILRVPGIRKAMLESSAPVVAISPIIGGRVIKGPLAKMFRHLDYEISPFSIAKVYIDLLDVLVVDKEDEKCIPSIKNMGIHAIGTDTMMDSREKRKALASFILNIIEKIPIE